MSTPAGFHRYTYADYLALEQASNVKHEFLRGEICGMAGCTPEHAAERADVAAIACTLVVDEVYRDAFGPSA
jgi:hypothetical protein